ncbi:hypothetical protein Poli38472_009103 [Pythium oligandrum]|uniref:MSP domain-containing protein n=1 Tax=Pythium oligandrum TaxID=41045 RepID=A0A8K1FJH8_PYTOL|nr:hypothetical protein Poli38472_009103 [Pythium oligandrum]|eukprot:TMW64936.1 hypothetical protein Poli38472_009103 [Pythium oligandrum]
MAAITASVGVNSSLLLAPSHALTFPLEPSENGVQTYLSLSNLSTRKSVIFKIRTTNAEMFLVKPAQGVLEPTGSMTVQITIVPAALNRLFGMSPMDRANMIERFLVQSVDRSEDMHVHADDLNSFWKRIPTEVVTNKKMTCHFVDAREVNTLVPLQRFRSQQQQQHEQQRTLARKQSTAQQEPRAPPPPVIAVQVPPVPVEMTPQEFTVEEYDLDEDSDDGSTSEEQEQTPEPLDFRPPLPPPRAISVTVAPPTPPLPPPRSPSRSNSVAALSQAPPLPPPRSNSVTSFAPPLPPARAPPPPPPVADVPEAPPSPVAAPATEAPATPSTPPLLVAPAPVHHEDDDDEPPIERMSQFQFVEASEERTLKPPPVPKIVEEVVQDEREYRVHPSDMLVFQVKHVSNERIEGLSFFFLTNKSRLSGLAYKVKTTNHDGYFVKPARGVIGPKSAQRIDIFLHDDNPKTFDPHQREKRDRFLVEILYLEAGVYRDLMTQRDDQPKQTLQHLWEIAKSEDKGKTMLKCEIFFDSTSMIPGSGLSDAPGVANGDGPSSIEGSGGNRQFHV